MRRKLLPALIVGLLICSLPGILQAAVRGGRGGRKLGSSIAHITVYNWKGSFIRNGWGFFINERGDLVTWRHLLEGGSLAEVTTISGETVEVTRILSEDEEGGFVVAGLEYPPDRISYLETLSEFPGKGERVLVGGGVGCDPGAFLDGRVVSVRKALVFGTVVKISSPFATSGSPVFNEEGLLAGVVFLKPEGSGSGAWAVPASNLGRLLKKDYEPVDYAQWAEQEEGRWFDGATGSYLAGLVYYWAGDFENAMPYLERAACDDRFAWEAHTLRGCCNDALARHDLAIEAYLEAIELGAKSPEIYLKLAGAYRETGDYKSAISSCWNAIRIKHSSSKAFLQLAVIYNSMGNFQNALASSYAAIKLRPACAEAYVEAGVSFRCMNRFPDAERLFRKALQTRPNCGMAYWHLALTYYYRGDIKAAMEICRALRPINPKLAEKLFAGLGK